MFASTPEVRGRRAGGPQHRRHGTPLRLTAEAIADLPRTSVTWAVHGKTMVCEGPWLTNVLARAGVPSGDSVRRKLLSTTVVATGRDGYAPCSRSASSTTCSAMRPLSSPTDAMALR